MPRWALSCYWRADGVPVWENVDLIAREDQDYGFGAADALKFMRSAHAPASGELRKYACLPTTPKRSRRSRPDTFCRFAAVNRQGQLCWSSQLWFPRPERLLLSPGDSPIGYRIPTEAMPWVAPDELEYEFEAAPFADRVKLPATPGAAHGSLRDRARAPIRCLLFRAQPRQRRS